ncbi:emp24p/erv25p- protein [Geranomyces variabilis]|nr:emp24p/erv25p- protein [Geranomyces variabilis]
MRVWTSAAAALRLALLTLVLCVQVNALYFYLEGSKPRCFFEELPQETTAVGNYKTESLAPGKGSHKDRGLQVIVEQVANRHRVLSLRGDHTGKFTFTTADPGQYSICLSVASAGWFSSSIKTRIHLDLKFGDASSDIRYDGKTESLSALALQLRNLNIKVSNVWREQQYQKEREAAFRNVSEKANAHVRSWTLAQLAVMAAACAWQIRHLKGFFIAKKLGNNKKKVNAKQHI